MKGLDYDQLFPGRFIKAGDLHGKDVTLTISDVEIEELPQDKGGDKAKGIVSFKEAKKKLVLNRTNGECIKAMFGRTCDDWIGKRITIYPAPFDGDIAIRIKGSPDLKAPIEFEFKLPRKKPVKRVMQVTGKGNGKSAADEPPAEHWEKADREAGKEG